MMKVRRRFWQYLHHCWAHPLWFLTGFSDWAWRFHDYTAERMEDGEP